MISHRFTWFINHFIGCFIKIQVVIIGQHYGISVMNITRRIRSNDTCNGVSHVFPSVDINGSHDISIVLNITVVFAIGCSRIYRVTLRNSYRKLIRTRRIIEERITKRTVLKFNRDTIDQFIDVNIIAVAMAVLGVVLDGISQLIAW